MRLMVEASPKVSVVVITYNRPFNDVVECLNAVRAMSYPNFEVILVDNSTDSPSSFSSISFEGFTLIDMTGKGNLGASGGRNIGTNFSKGEYLYFVDDDVIVDKGGLTELVRIMAKKPSIGIIGPLMYFYDDPSEIWFYKNYREGEFSQDFGDGTVDVPMVVSGALLIKKELLERIGFFDEIYFFYHEDWDLNYRVQEAGYRTVCAKRASSWHKVPREDYLKLFDSKRAYYWHRNHFIFAGRNKKTITGVLSFLFKQLVYCGGRSFPIFYVSIALRTKRLDALKAYFHGILDGVVCLGKLWLI